MYAGHVDTISTNTYKVKTSPGKKREKEKKSVDNISITQTQCRSDFGLVLEARFGGRPACKITLQTAFSLIDHDGNGQERVK